MDWLEDNITEIVALVVIAVIAMTSIIVLKGEGKEIAAAAIGVIGGYIAKTAVDTIKARGEAKALKTKVNQQPTPGGDT